MLQWRSMSGGLAGLLILWATLLPGADSSQRFSGRTRSGEQLVRIVVVDDAGTALDQAQIKMRAQGRTWSVQTNLAGTAVLSLPVRVNDVEVEIAQDAHSDFRSVVKLQDQVEPWRFTLERQSQVRGIALGPQGVPVERVEVFLVGSGVWPAKRVFSDQRGEFVFYNLRAGVYEISGRKNELIAEPVGGVQAQPGASNRITLQLSVGEKLTAQIVDAQTQLPLPNAQVWAQRRSTAIESSQLELDGRARFEMFVGDNDAPVLYIEAPGYLPLGPYAWPSNKSDTRIELVRGRSLHGRVVDSEGRPLADAAIAVEFGDGRRAIPAAALGASASLAATIPTTSGVVPKVNAAGFGGLQSAVKGTRSQRTQSDARGEFLVQSIPDGTLRVTIEHPDYAPLQTWTTPRNDLITFKLIRGGIVKGRVIDSQGVPVAGVSLEVQSEDAPSQWLSSDRSGEFVSKQAYGKVVITARPSSGNPERVQVNVAPGQEVQTEIRIAQGHLALEGQVVSQNRDPLIGVTITLRSLNTAKPGKWTQLSDNDGLFKFSTLHDGLYQISVEQSGYVPQQLTLQVPSEKVRVLLERGLSLQGIVVDDFSSLPVSNATVCSGSGRNDCARTDRTGKFTLPNAREGNVTLSVSHEQYATLHETRNVYADTYRPDAPMVMPIPLRLLSAGRIEGDVIDAYGTPVEGASVSVAGSSPADITTLSDQRGHFVLQNVASGDQWLNATHRFAGSTERAGPVRVYRGQLSSGVRIQLPRTIRDETEDKTNDWRVGVPIALRIDSNNEIFIAALLSDDPDIVGDLKTGDKVLAIDERDVANLEQARAALAGPARTEVVIRIQRGNAVDSVLTQRIRYDAQASAR